jgi:CDP-6-deoxy-D-xylo-4-hexulose-3-dehydrase
MQMERIGEITKIRQDNYFIYKENIQNNLFEYNNDWNCFNHVDTNSNFAYPLINKNRDKIIKELLKNDIECRPLVCGNMSKQPFLKDKMLCGANTPIADCIDKWGMYLPNHTSLSEKDILFICDIVNGVENV